MKTLKQNFRTQFMEITCKILKVKDYIKKP